MQSLRNKGVTTWKITNYLYCKYFETKGYLFLILCGMTYYAKQQSYV